MKLLLHIVPAAAIAAFVFFPSVTGAFGTIDTWAPAKSFGNVLAQLSVH